MNKKLVLSVLSILVVGMTVAIGARSIQEQEMSIQEYIESIAAYHKPAKDIMGRNFFGVEEVIEHFRSLGVNPTKEQLAVLEKIPYTKEMLQSRQNTHILVAVFPISLLDMHRPGHIAGTRWYLNTKLGTDKGEVGWYLVRKTPAEGSLNRTYEQQKALLKEEEVLATRVLTYTIIGHCLNTGEELFSDRYVRTADTGMHDITVVTVGEFRSKTGLTIKKGGQDFKERRTGLAAFLPPLPVR